MIDILILGVLALSFIGFVAGMILGWNEFVVGGFMIVLLATLFGGLGYAITMENAEHRRLIAQCMEDGKKEYECEALLKEPQSRVMPMPIVIPIR